MKCLSAFALAASVSLCAFGGERVFIKCDKPLRFEFSNTKHSEFPLPGLKEAFAAIPPEERPRDFYIKCRAVRLDGSVSWKVYAAGNISYLLPISQVGRVETLRIRPEIVSVRKTAGYDYSRLKDLRLVGSGSGEIEIFEFGTTDVGPKPAPHDAGLPPVGIDDFAIFPEPRIFKQEGARLPLKAFGETYRLEGDVPPAPVSRFVRDMKDFYGIGLKPSEKARIAILVTDRIDIPGYDQVVHDGFAISVTKRGICVAAKDPRGIVFGLGVLSDSIKMVSGDVGEARVPLMTVVDWPRMGGVRLFNDMVQCSLKYQKYDADFYVDMFERFVLASRFNMLAVEPSDSYKWASAPYSPVKPSAWDRAEFEHIVDRVNANAVSVVPKMNGLGHVNHWPLGNDEANRRYGEDGNKMVLCTANPEANKMYFDTFAEILSICSKNPKYAPRYFHAGMDEVRWQTDELPPESRCRLCAGRAKNAIFLEQVERVDDWCRARGLRMVMWVDMIRAYHNGLNKFRCFDIEPQIPKDVIYANWSSHDFFEMAASAAAGHENWKCLTGYKDDPDGDELVSGYGLYICTYNWWLSSATVKGFGNGAYGLMAQRILADQMWRRKPSRCAGDGGSLQAHDGDGASLLNRWGDFLLRNWSRKPIPHGAATFTPMDISGVAMEKVSAEMDLSTKSVGGVPVTLPVKDGALMAVAATEAGITIPVGRRAASLCFLHAAPVKPENKALFSGFGTSCRIELEGVKVAEYEVVYADGGRECVRVGHGWNVPAWSSLDRLFYRFARYPTDSRGIWVGRLAEPTENGEPQTAVASLYEWVNPHPEKVIASLRLKKDTSIIDYSLFALTLRTAFLDSLPRTKP